MTRALPLLLLAPPARRRRRSDTKRFPQPRQLNSVCSSWTQQWHKLRTKCGYAQKRQHISYILRCWMVVRPPKNVERFTILRVILAQGPCWSSLYRSNFSISTFIGFFLLQHMKMIDILTMIKSLILKLVLCKRLIGEVVQSRRRPARLLVSYHCTSTTDADTAFT